MYRVKEIRLSSGERLPALVDNAGQPLFEPMVYVLTELRARNRASNSIRNTLQSIIVFLLFLDNQNINISQRLLSGNTLSISEIDMLVRFSRLPIKHLEDEFKQPELKRTNLGSLERHRGVIRGAWKKEVSPDVAATRLRYVRDYLTWLTLAEMSKPGISLDRRKILESINRSVRNLIDSRLPIAVKSSSRGIREGLEPSVSKRILEIVNPEFFDNPWKNGHVRQRNALVISWLHYLGLRRGELLKVRIPNIDFRKGTVVILRDPDDPNDPRKQQPQVKTRARELELSPTLLEMTQSYILDHRSKLPDSKKHNFLFVANRGDPLSIPSLDKIFRTLKAKFPELPASLSPHVFRHTWNDRFSKEMEERRISEEDEKKARSYLMGWSETSNSAATYTRRYVRKKAQEVSLTMQEKMFKDEKND